MAISVIDIIFTIFLVISGIFIFIEGIKVFKDISTGLGILIIVAVIILGFEIYLKFTMWRIIR